jgi:hypothetical protein
MNASVYIDGMAIIKMRFTRIINRLQRIPLSFDKNRFKFEHFSLIKFDLLFVVLWVGHITIPEIYCAFDDAGTIFSVIPVI